MGPSVGPHEPPVELRLEILRAEEAAPRLEVGLHVALQALHQPLRLRIRRLAEKPADPELAAEAGERLARPAIAGVQGALAIPHQRPRQPAEAPQATSDAPQKIRRLLAEHQCALPTRE